MDPSVPRRSSVTVPFTVEVLAYLGWLLVDVVAAPNLSPHGTFLFSGPLAGVVVAAAVLARYRIGERRSLVVALTLSALMSLVALGTGGLPEVSLAEMFALAVVTVATVRIAPGPQAVGAAAAAFVVILLAPSARFGEGDGARFVLVAVSGLGWAGTVAVAAVLRELRMRREARIAEARSAERMELARELHDVVAHHVTGIVVAAQAAVTVARTQPDEAGRALESIERAGAEALDGMRRMVGVLRGGEQAGRAVGHGPSDVEELVARFDPTGRRTVLERDPDLVVLPPGVGETVYRVVQEALTNVHRHAADAATVHVGLHRRDGSLEVSVRNDGGGSERRASTLDRGGFGLAGMAERVGALGGRLQVGPDGPGAWLVRVQLPLDGTR